MPSFGEQLRQARESQNITLQEIAATTKISARALQALESEQFDRLPGGIFNKGFVRAYARYVGLDEEKMLASYLAVAKPEASEEDMQTISSQLAAAQRPRKEPRIGGTTIMGVLAVIVALALGAVWFREHRKEALEQAAVPAASAPQTSAPSAPAPEPSPDVNGAAGTTGEPLPGEQPGGEMAGSATSVGAEQPNAALNQTPSTSPNVSPTPNVSPNVAPDLIPNGTPSGSAKPAVNADQDAAASSGQASPVEVSISATQKAWISVRSDGKKIESLTLDPDNPELRSRSYTAREKLKLVVGNAGGVTAVCNGKPEGALGAMGQKTTITFTSQGMQKQ